MKKLYEEEELRTKSYYELYEIAMAEKLIELLLKLRNDARKEKNFKLSDEIRDSLKELGIEIKDNKDGTSEYTI